MPTTYELDAERRTARARAWGALTEDELVTHQRAIRAHFDAGTIDAS